MTARDWKDVRPGWHEIIIQLNEEYPHNHRVDILEWIEACIQMPDRHCVYTWTEEIVKIKFRYQRDYILARLRW